MSCMVANDLALSSNAKGCVCDVLDRRWHISMPSIVGKSISILSDAGLGMAMFSLGGCPHAALCSCLRLALHPQL